MNEISQELVTRFSKIICKPRDYGFYLAVHEYMDFVYKNEILSEILLRERAIYREHHYLINVDWQRALDLCDQSNDELTDEIDAIFGEQVDALEAGNLFCRYIGSKSIYYIIEKSRGVEEFKNRLELYAREDTTNDLQEIRFGKISKENGLVNSGAGRIYKSLASLHFGFLDRLFTDELEKEESLDVLKKTDENTLADQGLSFHFDKENSILFLGGEKIPIAIQDKETFAHKILAYMLIMKDDPTQEFFFSDMAADSFFLDREYHDKKNAWQRYYAACKDINEKIRKATLAKTEDFLLISTSKTARVMINPKYLGKNHEEKV